jgi:hypothetical protein
MADLVEKKKDDLRPVAALVCVFAGTWLMVEWSSYGGFWRMAAGVAFALFGLIRFGSLLQSSRNRPADPQ